MKACMVAYTFYDTDARVRRYAESLAEQGHDVDVISLRHPGQSRKGLDKGVSIYRIQEREINEKDKLSYLRRIMAFLVKSFLLITRKHLTRKYDLVHVHNIPDFEVFAALIPKLSGAKVILDIHDLLPEFYAAKFNNGKPSLVFHGLCFVEKMSCAFSDHVIISNDLWRDKLTRRSVVPRKCTTLLNYPDLQVFTRSQVPRSTDKFVLLYPGTLNWHQGVDVAIKAVSRIANEARGIEFHIYGEGPSRAALVDLVHDLGLDSKVFFHTPVPLKEVARIMGVADVGIVPKRADAFGNEAFSTKILEFMGVGVPVIVAETKIDRYYFNGSLVKFFSPEDEKELANAILAMARDESMRARLVDNGLKHVSEHNWRAKQHLYLDIVSRITGVDVGRQGV